MIPCKGVSREPRPQKHRVGERLPPPGLVKAEQLAV